MIEFKSFEMVKYKSNSIGFCMTEIDDNTTIKMYFYINRDNKEIYYLHNPMREVFKIGIIDDI